jgi:hypothetical protein
MRVKLASNLFGYLFSDMAVHFSTLLAMPTSARSPITHKSVVPSTTTTHNTQLVTIHHCLLAAAAAAAACLLHAHYLLCAATAVPRLHSRPAPASPSG